MLTVWVTILLATVSEKSENQVFLKFVMFPDGNLKVFTIFLSRLKKIYKKIFLSLLSL